MKALTKNKCPLCRSSYFFTTEDGLLHCRKCGTAWKERIIPVDFVKAPAIEKELMKTNIEIPMEGNNEQPE